MPTDEPRYSKPKSIFVKSGYGKVGLSFGSDVNLSRNTGSAKNKSEGVREWDPMETNVSRIAALFAGCHTKFTSISAVSGLSGARIPLQF